MTTGPRPGLEAVLADGLADLANASLDSDPATRARLAAMDGQRVQISAELPPPLGLRHFGLEIQAARLRFHARALQQPNVIVRGSPAALMAWLTGIKPPSGDPLTIDGDSAVLQELSAVLRSFRPDPTRPLGRLLGVELADRLVGGAEMAVALVRSALEGAGTSVREGSAQMFVGRRDAERFLDELDDLRLRVDRLAARVESEELRRTAR